MIRIMKEPMTYTPVLGDSEVRKTVADFVSKRDGVKIAIDNIAITSGAIQGIFAILNAIKKEGEVLLPDPSWSAYDFPIRACGLRSRRIEYGNLDDTRTIAQMNKDTVAIIVNNPENPTGKVYDEDNLIALVETITRLKSSSMRSISTFTMAKRN